MALPAFSALRSFQGSPSATSSAMQGGDLFGESSGFGGIHVNQESPWQTALIVGAALAALWLVTR